MSGRKALVALACALTILGAASAIANDDTADRNVNGGAVVPCSLAGVNPVFHPEIFGNAAVAKSYGFVRSQDGSWRVQDNCQSSVPKNQR